MDMHSVFDYCIKESPHLGLINQELVSKKIALNLLMFLVFSYFKECGL